MPLILLFLAGAAGLYSVADWSALFVGVDGWELALRVLAAGALVWHPIHEQRWSFQWHFNYRAADGVDSWGLPLGWPVSWPLSRRQNALQATALATVFPTLALVGPWWALWGLMSFYASDTAWTHLQKRVPGAWSAHLGTLACGGAAIYTAQLGAPYGFSLTVASVAAGLILLALPWWLAWRRVQGR